MLNRRQHDWLRSEWNLAIGRAGIGKSFIHMKDFGEHGALASFPIDRKRSLLADLADIIADRKQFSIGSTLTPEEYKVNFSFLSKEADEYLSIHSACFLQAAITQAKWAEDIGYLYDIPFTLDEGCPDRDDIDKSHRFLIRDYPGYHPPFPTHAGDLTWEDDRKFPSLQAGDVIAWAVRRKAAGLPFNAGCEPLLGIFDDRHLYSHFKKDWMEEAASNLRVKLERT